MSLVAYYWVRWRCAHRDHPQVSELPTWDDNYRLTSCACGKVIVPLCLSE